MVTKMNKGKKEPGSGGVRGMVKNVRKSFASASLRRRDPSEALATASADAMSPEANASSLVRDAMNAPEPEVAAEEPAGAGEADSSAPAPTPEGPSKAVGSMAELLQNFKDQTGDEVQLSPVQTDVGTFRARLSIFQAKEQADPNPAPKLSRTSFIGLESPMSPKSSPMMAPPVSAIEPPPANLNRPRGTSEVTEDVGGSLKDRISLFNQKSADEAELAAAVQDVTLTPGSPKSPSMKPKGRSRGKSEAMVKRVSFFESPGTGN